MEAVFYHKQFGAKLNNIKNDLPLLKDFICIKQVRKKRRNPLS
jgi:hypothetical protein